MSKLLKKKQLNKKIKNFTINLGLNGSKRFFTTKSTWCAVCKCYKSQTILNGPAGLGCIERNLKLNIERQRLLENSSLPPKIKLGFFDRNEKFFIVLAAFGTLGLGYKTLQLEERKFNWMVAESIEKKRIRDLDNLLKSRLAVECANNQDGPGSYIIEIKPHVILKDNNEYSRLEIENARVLRKYLFYYSLLIKNIFLYIFFINYPFLATFIVFSAFLENLYYILIK